MKNLSPCQSSSTNERWILNTSESITYGEWGYGRWWYYTAWLHYIIPTEWDVCRDTAVHYLFMIHIISFIYRLKTRTKKRILSQPTVWLCGPPELSKCVFCFRIVAQHVAKPAEHFGNSGRKELQVRRSQFSERSAGRKTGTLLQQNELVAQSHTVQSLLCHTCQESGGTCTPSLCTRLLGMESSTLHNTKSDCKQRDPEARN